MNASEWRATSGLSLIYVLRMLGLFMVLPVLAVYADGFAGVAGWQIGMAVGIYGLTQAALQIPFGVASDRFGRRPLIVFGLLIFAVGSVVAAQSQTIGMLIAGRALQGAGAIAAVCTALLADLTSEARRTTAMAILGVSIGMAFLLSLMLGPIIAGWVGVDGLFYLAAGLALGALPVLFLWIPKPQRAAGGERGGWRHVLRDRQLLMLDLGIFVLHASITAIFVVIPLTLRDVVGLEQQDHWRMYVPVMLLSVVALPVLLYLAERRAQMRRVFAGCVFLLCASLFGLGLALNVSEGLFLGLLCYFVAFNFLEASLPSMTSRAAPAAYRGAAMGVYSSSQFLGAFAGGAAGGLLLDAFGAATVLIAAGVPVFIWLVALLGWHPQITTATVD